MFEQDDQVGDGTRDGDPASRPPHVARRDVAPPAVIETEHDEHRQLHDDDDRDRVDHQPVVRSRNAVVEAQPEGEPPGECDQRRIGEDVPDPVSVDRNHRAATAEAERTTSTTRSCVAASIPAQSGTEKFSRASCSVTGRSPSR